MIDELYPPYPHYKPSGGAWLGEIPSHWEVRRLKFVAQFAYGNSLSVINREEGKVPVFGSNGMVGRHNQANTLAPCVVIGRKGSFGKVNYSEVPVFAIDTTFYIDQRYTKQDLRWLYYVLCLLDLDESSQDSAVPGLSREFAYNKVVPFPDISEQRAIAVYLDRETARIDTLIVHKRDLLALLERQRTALISHAVTKGLNPDAPLKPSGVAWLGEIPSHWEVRRLKFVASQVTVKLDQKPADMVYLGLENVESGTGKLLLESPTEIVDSVVSVFKQGDVLFGKLRPYLAKVVHPNFDGVCTSELMVLRPYHHYLDARFLFYLMLSHGFISIVDSMTYGAKMPRANPNHICNLEIVLPPLAEQRVIAEYLDREMARIDRFKAEIASSIELLERYRVALISAAVTGKIDVRGR